ncbi:MAG: hypothetical protein ACK5WM_08725, partial [Rhodospirillales bacterium]
MANSVNTNYGALVALQSLNNTNQQLNIAKGTIATALEATTSISNTLIKVREVTTKLADTNLSTSQRSQYNADLSRLAGEVTNFISNAEFNGTNLLGTIAGGVSVISNVGGSSFTVTNQELSVTVRA